MAPNHRDLLKDVRAFPQLIKYLHDELDWPISSDNFEDLTFDYTPEELGIDRKNAAKIKEIRRLRPLVPNQPPWAIFFVKFEPKRLPVVALRRILSRVVFRKRASANVSERPAWSMNDLLFISNYGESEERRISLAHFSQNVNKKSLPTLKVLGWDNLDTPLHLDNVSDELHSKLTWPEDENDIDTWRKTWTSAFTLQHLEVINTSKSLSIRLAKLAQSIRACINDVLSIETENGPRRMLMKAVKKALIHDLDEDSFADMYAQTIAYGLLSSRITNPKPSTADDFLDQIPITNPFLKDLMETFLSVGEKSDRTKLSADVDFDELGVNEVVELLNNPNTHMEAIVRDFGDRNPQEDPVIHFYELFLKEYDAKKRMQRGVFYTPRPVVSFIVRSVDELLRTKFSLEDGLADTITWGEMTKLHDDLYIPEGATKDQPFVQILDPATGTGTFLVEVIDLIHKTMTEKWQAEGHSKKKTDKLWNEYVPKYLLPRLYGYELLMAPYAIAHLKIGLKLYETGYCFGSEERVRVYLTNALEPASLRADAKAAGLFEALGREAQAVNEIKRNQRFTVVIGNPPYAGLSANMSEVSAALIERYKFIDGVHFGERKHWLHDDYVKFIRLGELAINATTTGILCFITNHGFLDNPTFRGMRWNILSSFTSAWLLDLHGNTMRKEAHPQGGTDKNVFDIQQGVSISTFSTPPSAFTSHVSFGEIWGTREEKYQKLLAHTTMSCCKVGLSPIPKFFLFVPKSFENQTEYQRWLPLNEVFNILAGGFITARDHFVISVDQHELTDRIETFVNSTVSDNEIRETFFKGMGSRKYPDGDSRGWKLPIARGLLRADPNRSNHIQKCLYRPFDVRWIYWAKEMIDWPRPEVNGHLLNEGNLGLVFMRQVASGDSYSHFLVSRMPADNRACYSNKGIMSLAPLYLYSDTNDGNGELVFEHGCKRSNFSRKFYQAFQEALPANSGIKPTAELVFHYLYAVLNSATYRSRYEEMLKIDFPRIPITTHRNCFNGLAKLGDELVAFHLFESPLIENLITNVIGSRHFQVEKVSYSNNTVWIDKAKSHGFRGVSEEVWKFHIGGYQVCEKWLKDRGPKKGNPGRVLTEEDLNHYQKIVVALNETIRIMKEIDEVIEEHGGWPGAFQTG